MLGLRSRYGRARGERCSALGVGGRGVPHRHGGAAGPRGLAVGRGHRGGHSVLEGARAAAVPRAIDQKRLASNRLLQQHVDHGACAQTQHEHSKDTAQSAHSHSTCTAHGQRIARGPQMQCSGPTTAGLFPFILSARPSSWTEQRGRVGVVMGPCQRAGRRRVPSTRSGAGAVCARARPRPSKRAHP